MDAATVRVVHGPPGSGDYSHRDEGGEKSSGAARCTTSDLPAIIVRQVLTAVEPEADGEGELGVEGL